MFNPRNIQLHQELLTMAEEKIAGAINPAHLKMLLAGGAGAALTIPAVAMMHAHDKKEQAQTRNRAFGAGVAAGAVSPHIVRNLFDIAQANNLMAPPQGSY